MKHPRTDYRDRARAALAACPRFARIQVLKVWPGATDLETLPVLGVVTPQETCEQHGRPSVSRRTLLQIVVRRAGLDDVEDDLDADSTAIEAVISETFLRAKRACFLEDTSMVTNTDGRQNIGTLVMSFRLTRFEPIARLA